MACKRINIKGRVQGVGFRYATVRKAEFLGAKGFVHNEMDGSVTIVVSGNDRETRLMEKWIRDQETPGHINSFTVEEYPEETFEDFRVVY